MIGGTEHECFEALRLHGYTVDPALYDHLSRLRRRFR